MGTHFTLSKQYKGNLSIIIIMENDITNSIIVSCSILGSVYLLNKSLERLTYQEHKNQLHMDKVVIIYTCIVLFSTIFTTLKLILANDL